jgi:hypothetical protein
MSEGWRNSLQKSINSKTKWPKWLVAAPALISPPLASHATEKTWVNGSGISSP